MQLFAASCEHHVLLAPLDLLGGRAHAVQGRGAGRADRIVQALDLERGGEGRRAGRAHGLGHRERTDPLGALLAGDVGGLHDRLDRRTARAHDQAGALVGDVAFLKPCIRNGLLHGHVGPASAFTHEAIGALVHMLGRIGLGTRVHLTLEAQLGVFRRSNDARLARFQAGRDFLCVVANG